MVTPIIPGHVPSTAIAQNTPKAQNALKDPRVSGGSLSDTFAPLRDGGHISEALVAQGVTLEIIREEQLRRQRYEKHQRSAALVASATLSQTTPPPASHVARLITGTSVAPMPPPATPSMLPSARPHSLHHTSAAAGHHPSHHGPAPVTPLHPITASIPTGTVITEARLAEIAHQIAAPLMARITALEARLANMATLETRLANVATLETRLANVEAIANKQKYELNYCINYITAAQGSYTAASPSHFTPHYPYSTYPSYSMPGAGASDLTASNHPAAGLTASRLPTPTSPTSDGFGSR